MVKIPKTNSGCPVNPAPEVSAHVDDEGTIHYRIRDRRHDITIRAVVYEKGHSAVSINSRGALIDLPPNPPDGDDHVCGMGSVYRCCHPDGRERVIEIEQPVRYDRS
jgi:hypothetical protein